MDDETLARIIEHSYLDLHSKGLDYICLRRSEVRTDKVYFFGFERDFDMSKQPEVVNPHDHRYDFNTLCLLGAVSNSIYARRHGLSAVRCGERLVYQEFEWRTPLNGGDGFTWKNEQILEKVATSHYKVGEDYYMIADNIHTIHIGAPETVIMLRQGRDVLPLDRPTSTFVADKTPPKIEGLYRKPTADDVLKRLAWLATKLPISLMNQVP